MGNPKQYAIFFANSKRKPLFIMNLSKWCKENGVHQGNLSRTIYRDNQTSEGMYARLVGPNGRILTPTEASKSLGDSVKKGKNRVIQDSGYYNGGGSKLGHTQALFLEERMKLLQAELTEIRSKVKRFKVKGF